MHCESLKTCENFRINITKSVISNITHCFLLNGKELPIHLLTIPDLFRDVFCDVYLRSLQLNVLHFRSGHVKSLPWILVEFRHNRIVQSPHNNYFNVRRQHKEK